MWQVTHDMWHLTPDRWQVTGHRSQVIYFQSIFLVSVLLSASVKRCFVSRMRDFLTWCRILWMLKEWRKQKLYFIDKFCTFVMEIALFLLVCFKKSIIYQILLFNSDSLAGPMIAKHSTNKSGGVVFNGKLVIYIWPSLPRNLATRVPCRTIQSTPILLFYLCPWKA